MPTDRVHDPPSQAHGPARMEVDGPDRLSWARRRSPDSQRGPETAGHTYNEPGRGAHIRRGRGQPRATARPNPGLVKKSSQAIHHEMREGLQRLLRLALR